jgi:hypothetical protein
MGAPRKGWLAFVVAGALAAPASADIIAAVDVPNGTTSSGCPAQWDLALIDAGTGARTALPSGINTSADELHPSISAFGTRLVFTRVDPTGGTTRIIAADVGSGQQADLFNAFQAQQLQPDTPALTPDGSVLTGAHFQPGPGSNFTPVENVTALTNFPAGPFSRTTRSTNESFANDGRTGDPVERSDGLVATAVGTNAESDILLDTGGGAFKLATDPSGLTYPAFSDPATNVVVFERFEGNAFGNGFLSFRPVDTFGSAATVNLPALINPDHFDELHPAFTPDGRYLGFVRFAHGGDGHIRLFVFDTATQTLVNSSGIDLGNLVSFGCKEAGVWSLRGGLSLRETFQLITSQITITGPSALVSFQLAGSTGVGILVQRIVGHHKLLGHRVWKLRTVGRVPLGQFRRGHHKVAWDLHVNGRQLPPGRYLVTPRLVTARKIVHELGKPRVLTIR